MRIKILLLLVLFFLSVTNVFADTILFKSGKTIEGNIIEQTGEAVKLEVEGIPLTYYVSDIDSINGQKLGGVSSSSDSSNTTVSVQENSSNQTQPGKTIIQSEVENIVPAPAEVKPIDKETLPSETIELPKQEKETQDEQSQKISKDDLSASALSQRSSKLASLTPDQARMAVGVLAGMFLLMVIAAIIFHIYFALCLYFIAKKAAVEPAWLSWIPIANAFLMCKIAGVSYLWLLGLLVQFLPFIGILGAIYSVGLFIYLWYKIILVRNKPAWFVILMLIPIANLVVMGYLAFSE